MSKVTAEEALQRGRDRKSLSLTHADIAVTMSVVGSVPGRDPTIYISAISADTGRVVASSTGEVRPTVNREFQAATIEISVSGCNTFFAIDPDDVAAAAAWISGVFGEQQ